MNKNCAMLIFIPVIMTFLFGNLLISFPAEAHSPADMELMYAYEAQDLTVKITHQSTTPDSHYIETVRIYKNDILVHTQNYTGQPSTSPFSYYYTIYADDGDVLNVTANCSISGSITRSITVEMPRIDKEKMGMTISNAIPRFVSNQVHTFNLSINAGDCDFCPPVEGAVLNIVATLGSISNVVEPFGGSYRFTYTAPTTDSNITDTINITATRDGFDTGYYEFQVKVSKMYTGDGVSGTTVIDGVIGDDEYDFDAEFQDGDFRLHWKIDGDIIAFGMEAKTTGWLALGIEPSIRMKDADMYIGRVTGSGTVRLTDAYSLGEVGPHPADTEEGGTDDILEFGGTEDDGWTTIEFTRKLDTGDRYDKTIHGDEELDIIWAYGNDDEFDARHSVRGGAVLDLASGKVTEKTSLLWLFHATWMVLSFSLMITGVIIAKTQRKKRWWMKTHKLLGSLAALFAVLGLGSGLYMITVSTGQHFRVLHTWLGAVTLIVVVATPFLCVYMFKLINKMKSLKAAHRWVGRIANTLMIITILAGLSQAGII